MDKLERERSDSIRVHISALEYVGSEQVKELKLNGREIRNRSLLFSLDFEVLQYVVDRTDLNVRYSFPDRSCPGGVQRAKG